jgi:phosphomannomutase
MTLKFGTSGLRGLVEELQGGVSARHAQAFATHMIEAGHAKAGDTVYLGHDLRASSPAILAECADGLRAAGLVAADCGARQAAAIMITGSHIPADRNGIKFYRPDGEIDKDDEAAIVALAAAATPPVPGNEGSPTRNIDAALSDYAARFAGALAADALKGWRIGIYQHSQVARDLLVELMQGYGAEVVPLGRSETFVPVDTEAVSDATCEDLRAWAAAEGLDAILSTDGDSDRPLMADENGAVIRGDAIGLVSAQELAAATVVTPVTSNSGIGPQRGFAVARTRVGSPYVIAAMRTAMEQGASPVIGFEANGGLLTGSQTVLNGATLSPLPTRDAVLPMLCMLSAAIRSEKPLSRVVADLALPVAASGRLENFASARSAALLQRLQAGPQEVAAFLDGLGTPDLIDTTDGFQMFLAGGDMIHIRPSGNAPELRCYAESMRADRAAELVAAGLARAQDWTRAVHD